MDEDFDVRRTTFSSSHALKDLSDTFPLLSNPLNEPQIASLRSSSSHNDALFNNVVFDLRRAYSPTRLRRKPNSISTVSPPPPTNLAQSHMRRLSGIGKTPSFPPFIQHSEYDDNRPTSSRSDAPPSTSLLRTYSSPHPNRSPSNRKPPASHSSYGVETTCGPPPSYSTQRTLSQDRVWSPDRNSSYRSAVGDQDNQPLHLVPAESLRYSLNDTSVTEDLQSISSKQEFQDLSSPDTVDTLSIPTPKESITMSPPTTVDIHEAEEKRKLGVEGGTGDDEHKESSSDEHKSEDLFLNIARSDASRMSQSILKGERRRSRISLPFLSSTRPATSHKTTSIATFDSTLSPRSDAHTYYNKRSSLGQHVPGAFSRHHMDGVLDRSDRKTTPSVVAESVDESTRSVGRRNSNPNNDTLRPGQRQAIGRSTRLVSEANYAERPRIGDYQATESTISTTAPSTVWDELDDLKSRIRKLELTGKLPPSSAAAMTNSERPRTATTAATTMSASPKNKTVTTALPSAIEGIPSTSHPLLHEALGNAKNVVSPEIYQKLYATAQDALQLSVLTNSDNYAGSTAGVALAAERQVRRRTESMCRSLTELAIAMLSESRTTMSPATRPASRDVPSGLRTRRYSNDPERPPVTSRVQSRLETRRTSAPFGHSSTVRSSPEPVFQTPPSDRQHHSAASAPRLGRPVGISRSRTGQSLVEGNGELEEMTPTTRPVSRAMTEVGSYRQMARDRLNFSREYTSQHPLPTPLEAKPALKTPVPTYITSNLQSRRKYNSPSSVIGTQDNSPATPKEAWGRISIIPSQTASPVDASPDIGANRPSVRRSLGFASRISSVSSRLRAAKAERMAVGSRDIGDGRSPRDIAQFSGEAAEPHSQGNAEMMRTEES